MATPCLESPSKVPHTYLLRQPSLPDCLRQPELMLRRCALPTSTMVSWWRS